MPLVTDMKERIFEAARRANFVDPFTGLVPRSERALSGLLAFHGQRALIDWSQVPLLEIRDFPESRARADSLVKKGGTYVSEYLLLHASTEEENIWGHMPADVIYLSAESDAVVLWENKIGSSVGYGPASETNQFARQLRYLEAIRGLRASIKNVAYVLISGEEMLHRDCYRGELRESSQRLRHLEIPAFLVSWESVFSAKSAQQGVPPDAPASGPSALRQGRG